MEATRSYVRDILLIGSGNYFPSVLRVEGTQQIGQYPGMRMEP